MATRVQGKLKVLLYAPGAKYQNAYPGVGIKHKVTEAVKQNRLAWSTFDASGLSLIGPLDPTDLTHAPTVEFVDLPEDLGGVTSATYLDASQDVGVDWWQTGADGEWEDIEDPQFGGPIVYQRDGTEDTTYTATSKFQLPPFPTICLSLWRGEPNKEQTENPYTEINFGNNPDRSSVGSLSLIIPYGSAPFMAAYNAHTATMEPLVPMKGGSLGEVGGVGKGQRLWITIRCVAGCVFVQFGLGGSWAGWYLPTADWVCDTADLWFGYSDQRKDAGAVFSGPVRITHNGSQVAFRWWPIYHPPQATEDTKLVYTEPVDAGYTIHHALRTWGAMWDPIEDYSISADTCYTFRQPVWQDDIWTLRPPGGTGLDVTLTPRDPLNYSTNSTLFTWEAHWHPTAWTLYPNQSTLEDATGGAMPYVAGDAAGEDPSRSGVPHIHHWSSPFLFATLCTAPPAVITYDDWPTATDVTGEVQAVSITSGEGNAIGQLGIELRNHEGTFAAAKDGQLVAVQLGYLWSDSTDDTADGDSLVFVGNIATPGQNAKVGPIEKADFIAYDPLLRLRDEKATGTEPDFQFWTPKGAIAWLAQRAGFPVWMHDLNGSDDAMYLGTPGWGDDWENGIRDWRNDALVPAFGSELLDSCLEYARRDDESSLRIALDGTQDEGDFTTLFKVYKSDGKPAATDGTLWTLYEDAADDQYRVFDLSVSSAPMDPEQYADVVVVRGKDTQGGSVQGAASYLTRIYDPTDAAYLGGWRRMYVETREHCQTADACRARAAALLSERGRTARIMTVTTDVLAGAVKGDRVKITRNSGTGGKASNAGVLDVEFRITSISSDYTGPSSWPKTTLTARTVA